MTTKTYKKSAFIAETEGCVATFDHIGDAVEYIRGVTCRGGQPDDTWQRSSWPHEDEEHVDVLSDGTVVGDAATRWPAFAARVAKGSVSPIGRISRKVA